MSAFKVREHQWKSSNDGGEYCLHCGSRTGYGFHYITECSLRFNEKGFSEFLEFKNISRCLYENIYVRRFSSETYTKEELMELYENACSVEENEKEKDKKYVCCNQI